MNTRNFVVIIFSIMFLAGCTQRDVSEQVDLLTNEALLSIDQFVLSPFNSMPERKESGNWVIGIYLNNLTNSKVITNLSQNLLVFYKIDDSWYESQNSKNDFTNEWEIPPGTYEEYQWSIYVSPYVSRKDMTIRVFVLGAIDNKNNGQVVGMLEYIFKDGNLEDINLIENSK